MSMIPSSTDPVSRIEEYSTECTPIDLDALVRSGRRRRLAQRGALLGGVTVLAAATIGTVILVQPSGSGSGTGQVVPANSPRSDTGLLASHPASGRIDTLTTTATGWRAEAYVDSSGDLCEGWLDPTTSVVNGACGAELLASGPTNGTQQIDSPLQIEPEAAVSRRVVYAFGVAGPNSASVTVTDRGHPLRLVLSNLSASAGERAFLVRYPMPRIADWVDTATALDASGKSLGSMLFVAPDAGQPAGPQPTATP
jgi:hypothetical protein